MALLTSIIMALRYRYGVSLKAPNLKWVQRLVRTINSTTTSHLMSLSHAMSPPIQSIAVMSCARVSNNALLLLPMFCHQGPWETSQLHNTPHGKLSARMCYIFTAHCVTMEGKPSLCDLNIG